MGNKFTTREEATDFMSKSFGEVTLDDRFWDTIDPSFEESKKNRSPKGLLNDYISAWATLELMSIELMRAPNWVAPTKPIEKSYIERANSLKDHIKQPDGISVLIEWFDSLQTIYQYLPRRFRGMLDWMRDRSVYTNAI
jgi:hypothetical protein